MKKKKVYKDKVEQAFELIGKKAAESLAAFPEGSRKLLIPLTVSMCVQQMLKTIERHYYDAVNKKDFDELQGMKQDIDSEVKSILRRNI